MNFDPTPDEVETGAFEVAAAEGRPTAVQRDREVAAAVLRAVLPKYETRRRVEAPLIPKPRHVIRLSDADDPDAQQGTVLRYVDEDYGDVLWDGNGGVVKREAWDELLPCR